MCFNFKGNVSILLQHTWSFSLAIQNGNCIIKLFSRNIFFCHLTRPNSIFNKKLIALDILQSLITFLLNNSAVWYRCLFQEKHLTFPLTKAGKFFGSRSKRWRSLLSHLPSKSITKTQHGFRKPFSFLSRIWTTFINKPYANK